MHCHNDFHAKTGMFMQIIEAPTALRRTLGTWTQVAINSTICSTSSGQALGPTLSWNGTNTMKFVKQYPSIGKIWPPFEQTIRESMQFYGVPGTCYKYDMFANNV